jgi:hypothetical protein
MMTRATPVARPAVPWTTRQPTRCIKEPSRHGSSELAATPLLGARPCSVYPTLSCWPPVSGAAQAIQRAAIVSLLWLVVVAVFALAAARHLRARGWTVRIRAP